MFAPSTEPLRDLAEACQSARRPARRKITAAGMTLVCVAAVLGARAGTSHARILAAAVIAAAVSAAALWGSLDRRRLRAPGGVLRALARSVDPVSAQRALRALSLPVVGGQAGRGVSVELARLHVERSIAALPQSRIVDRASRWAGRVSALALLVGVAAAAIAGLNGWAVLEGCDVLLAWQGLAPISMQWLDGLEVTARPPDYLHQDEIHEPAVSALALPFGTEIALHGFPARLRRQLLLTDGSQEAPFVEDGAGRVLARWRLGDSVNLRVVARFGSVSIPQGGSLTIRSIPDEAPVVELETAPRQVRLVDATEDIPIRYRATDDHGLREVHLVMRSGAREERRVLSRLDGETEADQGGLVLRLRDPFLRASHAPVQVTVEAKDNDPLSGPKWGASAAITLVPPDVGEPEARRLDALRRVRDRLVDTLAWRVGAHLGDPAGWKSHAAEEVKRLREDEQGLDEVLAQAYAGLTLPGRSRSTLGVQREKVRAAVEAEGRTPGAPGHAATVAATEHFVLVADAVVRGLAARDTQSSARQLADVADDLVAGTLQAQSEVADVRGRGEARMDAGTQVLQAGAKIMRTLGPLGRDLGEIVEVDCGRVDRARRGRDTVHAELAARDLAARLHRPDPSFGSRGSTRRGGGESGGGRGTSEDEDVQPDDVEQAYDEAKGDLDRLSQDHAGAVGRTERLLSGAESDEEQSALREEAKRHAKAIREAARALPAVGAGSESWSGKGAAARDLAEQAARALEEARPDESAQAGRLAIGSLDEGKRIASGGHRGQSWTDDLDAEGDPKILEETRRKLEAEVRWAEDQVAKMRAAAAERVRPQLEQNGSAEEDLARRAGDLAQHARERESLPQGAIESIDAAERAAREAAEALKRGDAEKGLDRQHEAQRDLEAARTRLQDDEEGEGDRRASSGNDGRQPPSSAPVDLPAGQKGPEDFRRRVVRGLGQAAGASLKDAVQRYAEGLLR